MEFPAYQNSHTIRHILRNHRRVAMVGLSTNESRPSFFVGYYLQRMGFEVIPVNPRYERILGQKSYPDVVSIPEPPDVVDVFRRPDEISEVVDEAMTVGAKSLWLQFDVVNETEAARAQEAGLLVVMDKCMKIEHGRLRGGLHTAGMRTGVITTRRTPLL